MANEMIIKHFAEMLCKCRQRKTKCDDRHTASDLGEHGSEFFGDTRALTFKNSSLS